VILLQPGLTPTLILMVARVWNRRGYDMNIWSEKKRVEKIDYMHNNPVKRGLVAQPGDWPWSSWRFYYLEDSSVLSMDRMP
jgi:putative transposase